jgi:starch synthase (maltosyl-transferring)
MAKPRQDGRRRVAIEGVKPEIDAGRFPAKRVIGDLVRVEADIFADGHDSISAALLFRHESSTSWSEQRMQPEVNDRWFGEFRVRQLGRYF